MCTASDRPRRLCNSFVSLLLLLAILILYDFRVCVRDSHIGAVVAGEFSILCYFNRRRVKPSSWFSSCLSVYFRFAFVSVSSAARRCRLWVGFLHLTQNDHCVMMRIVRRYIGGGVLAPSLSRSMASPSHRQSKWKGRLAQIVR